MEKTALTGVAWAIIIEVAVFGLIAVGYMLAGAF
jgi:hypothetical protein